MNNIAYAYNWLIQKGLTTQAAAGVVGNLKAESNVDPLSNQVGGPGRGIAQWSEGGRWETLKAWAGKRDINSLETQMAFLWHELNTGYKHVLIALKGANTVEAATEVFMKKFEIPADVSPSAVAGRVKLASDVQDNVRVTDKKLTTSDGGGGGGTSGGGGGGVKFNENEFDAMLAQAGFPEWLLDEFPAIKDIYKDAIKHEWTPERFIGELKSSDWYQRRSDAMFEWDTTKQAEKDAQITSFSASVRDQAASLGVDLSKKEVKQLTEFALRMGYDANPAKIQDMIAHQYNYKNNGNVGGEIGTALDQIDQIAWDWGMNLSDKMRKNWAQKIATGNADVQGFKDLAESRARKDYSWLSEAFDSGRTLGEIADPYRQTMAQMLELSPDAISMKDRQIRKALSWQTGKGKKAEEGLASITDFEQELRNDSRWATTKNARGSAMDMGYKVLKDFGVI